MLSEARVEYLAWAKRAKDARPRVSLLESGLAPDPGHFRPDFEAAARTPVPLAGRTRTREAVSRRYGVPEAEVLPVLGTSLGLFLVAASRLRPGDRALVEHPGYEPLTAVPRAVGAGVDVFTRSAGDGWRLDPDRIRRALTPETRLVIVSDLHNPTGRMAGDDALAEVAALAAERGFDLLVDEVYRDFREGPVGTGRVLGPSVITVSSLTKVYGLPGLRGGWILASPERVRAMERILDVLHVVDPAWLDPLVVQALAEADRLRAEGLRVAAEGRARVHEADIPGLRIVIPDAGLCAWVELPSGRSGEAVARELLEEEGIAVVPGKFFGVEEGIRIGWGAGAETLPDALRSLGRRIAGSHPPRS